MVINMISLLLDCVIKQLHKPCSYSQSLSQTAAF